MWVRIKINTPEPSQDGGINNNMAHTYTNLLVHVVFGTQGHRHYLTPEVRRELFAYIGSLIKGKGR